jgi:hypothetical protein
VIILKEEVSLSAGLYDIGPKQQALILVSFLDSKEGRFPWLDTDIYRHLSTEKSLVFEASTFLKPLWGF